MSDATMGPRALIGLLGDWRSGGAAYEDLAARIRLLIIDGRIAVGTRLPAERELAARLGLSRTTIAAAYARLRESEHLESLRGSGSVTRLPAAHITPLHPTGADSIDFTKAALPALPWLGESARAAAERLPAYLGDPGYDPIGLPELREAIAARYAARGLPTDPDEILVTIGAQHAISLLSRTLVGRGDRALVESPTYPHAYEALRGAGARLVAVPVGGESGASLRAADTGDGPAIAEAIRHVSPSVAYLLPDFHNPTGRSLTDRDRELVVDAASAQGTVLIADETTAELDIDLPFRTRPLAAHGPAVMIGSVGKTVWGGIRLGWIRADRGLIRRLLAQRTPNDLGTPILEQLLVAELLPRMDDILELRRTQLGERRAHLERALAERFPQWQVPHVHGGLALWVHLGSPVSSQLALAARTHDLLITAGPRFGIDGAFERNLRIPLGYGEDVTERALDALEAAWGSMGAAPLVDADVLSAVV
ncbi:GntR family transcriptional regulator [Agromyces rhizosphaerae]|uniref:GntR family transcriptional regulator n=1 Tax=Agromyces rhizosphaerae TaxID=88374 RepID=A0A9W6CYG5_9MICO|nr:PLP-dependent aminotransferase family protein [Agromyces rhizosphaerae]GLI27594.1 GntR family transcriptional regulator [Agromyces rhizosphaerae]